MENNNQWFPEKKGKPFLEKFAMLFFGYLIAKYTVKAIKKMPKGKPVKMGWWMLFASWGIVGGIALANGWDVNSFEQDFPAGIAFIASIFLFSVIEGKSF